MKSNTFLLGDAIELMKNMRTESVDLIVTDPPYNLGKDYGNNIDYKEWHEYEVFTQHWLDESLRLLKPTGSIYVFMGVRFISKLFALMEAKGLLFNGWITWHYTQGMGRTRGFSPRHEDILYFTKSEKFTFNLDAIRIPQKYYRQRNNMHGANPGDVWEFSHVHYSNPERQPHPTQKPSAVMERMIKASSNEGDLILDPFVGSGTTCVVANAIQRKWIGIDINPKYIQMSESRIKTKFIPDSIDLRQSRTPRDLKNASSQTTLLKLN